MPDGDNGGPNRATIALVDAKVGEVKAIAEGIKTSMETGLEGVQRELARLADGPVDVAELQTEQEDLKRRIGALEAAKARRVNWRVSAAIAFTSALIGGAVGHIPHLPI